MEMHVWWFGSWVAYRSVNKTGLNSLDEFRTCPSQKELLKTQYKFALPYVRPCVISEFCRSVNEIFALLGCYPAQLAVSYRRCGTTNSTLSPFVTLSSRCAQAGRWSSYRDTGVVHRFTFSFSDFFYWSFIYLFYYWYKIKECYIPLKNYISRNLTQSLLCTSICTTPVRDCFLTGLLASVNCSQPFRRLNLSPPTYHQRFWIFVDKLNPKRTALKLP